MDTPEVSEIGRMTLSEAKGETLDELIDGRNELDRLKILGERYFREINRAKLVLEAATKMDPARFQKVQVEFPDVLPTREEVINLYGERMELCERVAELTKRLRSWNAID